MGFCEMVPTITGSSSGTQWVTLNSVIPKHTSPKGLRMEATVIPCHALPHGTCTFTDAGVRAGEPISERWRAVAGHWTGAQPLFSPSRLSTNLLKVPVFCVTRTHVWYRWQPSPLVPFRFGLPAEHHGRTVPLPAVSPEPLRLPLRLLCTLRSAGWLSRKEKHLNLF